MLKKGSFLRELPIIVVSALIVSIVVKTFLLHFFYIPSGSMENTLQVGDRIAVNKFGALFSEIKRGEVVVFGDPDNWLGQSSESANSGPIEMIKSGLITVGVLPDPAKQYRVSTDGSLHRNFAKLEEVMALLRRPSRWVIAENGALKRGEMYTVALRMALDTSQLPKPIQISVISGGDWQLSSDWSRFSFKAEGK